MPLRGLITVGLPKEPMRLGYARGAVLLFAVGVFIAACYNLVLVSGAAFLDASGPGKLALFTCMWTLIHVSLDLAISRMLPQAYFRIAFFIANWTTTVSWLAASMYNKFVASSIMDVCPLRFTCNGFSNSATAVAIMGAFSFLLMLMISTRYTIVCLRDFSVVNGAGNSNPVDDVELGEINAEGPDEQQQVNLSLPSGYHQQSPYQQQHQSYGNGTPGGEEHQQQHTTPPYGGSDLEHQHQQQHVALAHAESGAVPATGNGSVLGQNTKPQ